MAEFLQNIGSVAVYKSGNAFVCVTGLIVDGDGANGRTSLPCYAPYGMQTLDYLANAGAPGDWWGIATDSDGDPYVQASQDPAPGAYISTTALEDASKSDDNVDKYVDAAAFPFVVIPSTPRFGISLKDCGFALRLTTGDSSEFIVADIGPNNQIGEGSVKLAQNLTVPSSPKNGGIDDNSVMYIFFPIQVNWPCTDQVILHQSSTCFRTYGGFTKLKSEFPDIDFSKF